MALVERETLRAALASADTFERFCRSVRPHFESLLRSGLVERLMLRDLDRLAGGSARESVRDLLFDDDAGYLDLFPGPHQAARVLEGSGGHRLIGLMGGSVTARTYRHPADHDPNVLESTCVPQEVNEVLLTRGDVIDAEAWRDVVDIRGDGLLLVLRSSVVHPTRWAYDRHTLRPVGLMPATRALGRLVEGLELLSHIGESADGPICDQLAKHPAHAVRWQAIRTAFALECPGARALIENAVRDVHPEVREAATLALERWS